MTDSRRLSHAYGPADDIPALLEALSPNAPDDVWEALYSHLCHQGSVYPASFASLSHLAEIANRWEPVERIPILLLAGAILASTDVRGGTRAALLPPEPVIEQLRRLGLECLSCVSADRDSFIYLLQAMAAFRSDQLWGEYLDGLVDGELPGSCPTCGVALYLVVGEFGFFTATDQDWLRSPVAMRVPIRAMEQPANETETMFRAWSPCARTAQVTMRG